MAHEREAYFDAKPVVPRGHRPNLPPATTDCASCSTDWPVQIYRLFFQLPSTPAMSGCTSVVTTRSSRRLSDVTLNSPERLMRRHADDSLR